MLKVAKGAASLASLVARLAYNRALVRSELKNGVWTEWAARLPLIGNDMAFREQLSAPQIRHAISQDVGEGRSVHAGAILAFVAPSPKLLVVAQCALHDALHRNLADNPCRDGVDHIQAFTTRMTAWQHAAPALDVHIVQQGVSDLLDKRSGMGVGELTSAVAAHRPDLLPAAARGIAAGATGFFRSPDFLSAYPPLLQALAPVPELRGQLEAQATDLGYIAFPARKPTEGFVLQATGQRDGIVAHMAGVVGADPVPAQALGRYLLREAMTQPDDMRAAFVFEGIARFCQHKNPSIAQHAEVAQRALARMYSRQFKGRVSPALAARIGGLS